MIMEEYLLIHHLREKYTEAKQDGTAVCGLVIYWLL